VWRCPSFPAVLGTKSLPIIPVKTGTIPDHPVGLNSQFISIFNTRTHARTHAHTHVYGHFPGLPRWAGTRKVKPIWILLKQETVSGSGISWAACKSAPRSRQTTIPAPHHSVFTGWMPFLMPNQQRQSTEGKSTDNIAKHKKQKTYSTPSYWKVFGLILGSQIQWTTSGQPITLLAILFRNLIFWTLHWD